MIVITGATGYIGRKTVERAAAAGLTVGGLVRGGQQMPAGVRAVQFGEALPLDVFQGANAVIHLAGQTPKASISRTNRSVFDVANRQFALACAERAKAAGVGRFVLVSTTGIYGNQSVEPVSEDSPRRADTDYAKSKLQAEEDVAELLAGSATALVIVRPPMVYGLGAPGNFARLVRLVQQNVPLPLLSVTGARSFIHVDNLADFLLHTARSEGAAGDFVIGDGSDFTTVQLIDGIAKGLNVPVRLVSFPVPVLRAVGRMVGKRREIDSLTCPMRIDWSKAARVLNWRPAAGDPFELVKRSVEPVKS